MWGTVLQRAAEPCLSILIFSGLGLQQQSQGSARARRGHLRRPSTSNTPNNTKGRHTRSPVHSFGSPASPSGSPSGACPSALDVIVIDSRRSAAAMRNHGAAPTQRSTRQQAAAHAPGACRIAVLGVSGSRSRAASVNADGPPWRAEEPRGLMTMGAWRRRSGAQAERRRRGAARPRRCARSGSGRRPGKARVCYRAVAWTAVGAGGRSASVFGFASAMARRRPQQRFLVRPTAADRAGSDLLGAPAEPTRDSSATGLQRAPPRTKQEQAHSLVAGLPRGRAMADYEDHDLLVARHTSSRKDRHRRKKYRRDRVRPEDHDDLVAGLRQSHAAWTDVVKDRHADDDRYDYEDTAVAVGGGVAGQAALARGATTTTSCSKSSVRLATLLHRVGPSTRRMEKLLDRQRKLSRGYRRDKQSRFSHHRIAAVVSSMATGSQGRAAGGRTGEHGGLGRAGQREHDAAPPREMAPRTVLKWTEENVGEIFACIAAST